MRQVDAVCWLNNDSSIISGSRDSNIRLWRSNASREDKILRPREAQALNYADSLKNSFGSHSEVKKILGKRHVPRKVFKEKQHLEEMRNAEKRKNYNVFVNSKSMEKIPAEKDKHVENEFA